MALLEGVKYGLSQNQTSSSTQEVSSNKSVLFVKLTDSALKAIEEYLRIKQKTGQHATLQFRGNEGHIVIPSSQSSQGQTFDFSLQSNADIEGPQGSFECIQQCGSRSLESMGALPFKMRIKANDDVFDETKQKFEALEEERKHEGAKEIKSNSADLRGKVKKKLDRIPPMKRREPSPFNNQLSKSSPSNNNSSYGSKLPNGFSQSSFNGPSKGSSMSLNGNINGNSKLSGSSNPSSLNVAKRPLKERLIHLLALKPFKKPELIARLSRDGIKSGEKQVVMTLLKQVSTFKDNEYILMRGIWNDVQEDWPYYTEHEKQIMKRRKPQNLTPPGSDSSGCGSSPRSTISTGSSHSPPSLQHHSSHYPSSQLLGTKSQSSLQKGNISSHTMGVSQGIKRPASTDPLIGPDGLLIEDVAGYGDHPNSKKARVSHFKRPERSRTSNGVGGIGGNVVTNSRLDREGLSPHFNANRATDRLSPLNGNSFMNGAGAGSHNGTSGGGLGSSSDGLAHPMSAHRSPRIISPPNNITGVCSPSYYNGGSSNNQLSPPQDDPMMGGDYSPYSWNSKNLHVGGVVPSSHDSQTYLDSNKSRGMDSDETDSIDSGNGSSGSSSGRCRRLKNFDEPSYSGTKDNYNSSKSQSKSSKTAYSNGSELSNSSLLSANNNSNFNVTSASCNRVSSTTHTGTGSSNNSNGYHITPQSSPDSQIESLQLIQQQKEGCVVVKQGKDVGAGKSGKINGSGGNSSNSNSSKSGHGSSSHQSVPVVNIEAVASREQSAVREKDRFSSSRADRKAEKEKERPSGKDRKDRGDHRSDKERRSERENKKSAAAYNGNANVPLVNGGMKDSMEVGGGDKEESTKGTHYPPYLTQYTQIETDEQRSRYKDDFNAEYSIYRDLHAVIEKVSKKFAQLEERLREEERGTEEYQSVRDKIVREYYACKKDKKYQEAKEKFNYLHKKLAHIKALVAEFDNHSSGIEIASPVR